MNAHLNDWLNLTIRWAHLVAGIAWIGSSFFFMWLDSAIEPPESSEPHKKAVTGELWMVHSGGFYQVEKRKIAPGEMPKVLHWFKYEALITWITGFLLLNVVYYLTGGVYLVDPAVFKISVGEAVGFGIGLLVVSWGVYDLMWTSALASKKPGLLTAISLMLVCIVAYYLCHMFSGRAAYIHVGAMFGTIMVANVWMRILPAQSKMIKATERGEKPDFTLGERAKRRSVHNSYMTFPVLFIMLSNHFPMTYGHSYNWLVLIGLMVGGAGVRHFMIAKSRWTPAILVASLALIPLLFYVTAQNSQPDNEVTPEAPAQTQQVTPSTKTKSESLHENAPSPELSTELTGLHGTKAIDPTSTGRIRGIIHFEGTPPAARSVPLPGGCSQGKSSALFTDTLVKEGGLKNVFVVIQKGLEEWAIPAAMKTSAVLNQQGCIYEPRVIGVQAGQPLDFVNSDALLHNVHTLARNNGAFNTVMPSKNMRITKTFEHPELMVHAKCDVHPWMNAFIGVVPHPYYAVSDERGNFELKNVPPGDYVLLAWHEAYGAQAQKLSVAPRTEARSEFTFKAK